MASVEIGSEVKFGVSDEANCVAAGDAYSEPDNQAKHDAPFEVNLSADRKPAVVPCLLRWRIHKGQLPLRRRHLRALQELELPDALMGWVYERIEWLSSHMLSKDTEAVLVISIDSAGELKMSLSALRDAPKLSQSSLLTKDGIIEGVCVNAFDHLSGSVWIEKNGCLYVSKNELGNATDTLVCDLAKTLKISAIIEPQKLENLDKNAMFLISDEFGYVPIVEKPQNEAPLSAKIKECFTKLW